MDDVRDARVESNLPFLAVVRILGIAVALFSLTMLLPLGFAFFGNDAALFAYDEAILITAVSGIVITGLTWWHRRELYSRDPRGLV